MHTWKAHGVAKANLLTLPHALVDCQKGRDSPHISALPHAYFTLHDELNRLEYMPFKVVTWGSEK